MSSEAHWEGVYGSKPIEDMSWYQAAPWRSLEWIDAAAPDRAASILFARAAS